MYITWLLCICQKVFLNKKKERCVNEDDAVSVLVRFFITNMVSWKNHVISLFQPTKVLGIYTFTKRVALDDFENKPRKQQGYSTVSHFNIVHYDCHLAAVR